MNNQQNIILIGPLGTGKSTIAEHLSIRTGLRNIPVDKLKWYYRLNNGYDLVKSRNILRTNGFSELINYAQSYFGPREIHEILNQFSGIVDLGASDTHCNDMRSIKAINQYLEPYPNVFLIMPYQDEELSIQVLKKRLIQRYKDDRLKGPVLSSYLEKNEEFVRSTQNHSVAKHVVYTNDRSFDKIAEEIILKCDFSQGQQQRKMLNLVS